MHQVDETLLASHLLSAKSLGSTVIKILEDGKHKPLEFAFNFVQTKPKLRGGLNDSDGSEYKPASIQPYSSPSVGDGGTRVSLAIEGSTRKSRIGRLTRLDHDHPISKRNEKISPKSTRIASQLRNDQSRALALVCPISTLIHSDTDCIDAFVLASRIIVAHLSGDSQVNMSNL
jgi:hypothetical protein